ncbi:MAG: hypothetical protein R3247_00445 [Rhodothermales bacterium]|nr:hypothetical protein [Rhodothermales bacterium]
MFDPLDLHDSVVIMALFYEVVHQDQVARAWAQWRQRRARLPLWRVLLGVPGVSKSAVLGIAAEIYGIETADIEEAQTATFLRTLFASFAPAQWRTMVERLVVPIGVDTEPGSGAPRLILAATDPGGPAVIEFVESLSVEHHKIQYAPAEALITLLRRTFLGWWNEEGKKLAAYLEDRYPEEDDPGGAPPVSGAAPAVEGEPETASSSMAAWLEALLVAVSRRGVGRAEIHVREGAVPAVTLGDEDPMHAWTPPRAVPSEMVLGHLTDEIFGMESFEPGRPAQARLQRWIDGRLALYEIECSMALAEERFEGFVEIRLVGFREAGRTAKRLGPWKSR